MKTIKYLLVCCFTLLALAAFAQETISHVVAKGETITSIANKYNVSEAALLEENPILKNYIYVGMKIRIPSNAKKQIVFEEPAKSQKSPAEVVVTVGENEASTTQANVETEAPKKENYFKNSFFPERQPETFTPHRTYAGFAFYLPTVEGLGESLSAWGVEATGFGYQFFLSPNFFLDASGHIIFKHLNQKASEYDQTRYNAFDFQFPIMLGLEISGFQLRAGGFLEYTLLGWQAQKTGDKITRTLFSQMKPASPARFLYGVRFDASFGPLNVGFLLSWQKGIKDPGKSLSLGFKF